MNAVEKLLNASEIKSIVANKRKKSIEISIICNEYICYEKECQVKQYFIKKYKISNVFLNICYGNYKFTDVVAKDIVSKIIIHTPLLEPFKEDISITLQNNEYVISIPKMATHLFEINNTEEYIKQIFNKIDINKKIVKICYTSDDKHNNLIEQVKNEVINEIEKESVHVFKEKKNIKHNSNYKTEIKTPLMNICDINSNYNKVAIKGKIIKFEFRVLKEKYEIVTFDITDYTSSITCKTFLNKKNSELLKSTIYKNNYVIVEGDYGYDTYSNENLITLKKIEQSEEVEIIDNSNKKRVELHLHTKMSSMDGFIEVEELFETLEKWGHKHVAITDHGVLQAFPEVQKLAKKHNIIPIYGVEAYMIDDGLAVVHNPTDSYINKKYSAAFLNNDVIEILLCDDKNIVDKNSFNISNIEGIEDFIDSNTFVFININCNLSTIEYLIKKGYEVVDLNQLVKKQYNENISEQLLLNEFNIKEFKDCVTTFSLYEKVIDSFLNSDINSTNKICKSLVSDEQYKSKNRYHIILLAKNLTGLKHLYELVSYSHLNYFYKKPIMPKSIIDSKRNGLIIGSACEASDLYKSIVKNEDTLITNKIASFYDYLEIQPLGNNEYMVREELVTSINDIKEFNKKIVKIGENLNIPVVATCDAHFLKSRYSIFREIIMHGQKFKDAKNQPPLYLKTTDEMFEQFDYLDHEIQNKIIIDNTNLIASMVEHIKPIPDGTFPPKIDGSDKLLKESTYKRAKEIYGNDLPEIVEKRITKELDSIISHGFSVMYIIAQKLVLKSLSDGYLVGSRGSVGSSFVAFLSGITEVNSLQAHYVCNKCFNTDFNVEKDIDCGVDLKEKRCPKCNNIYSKNGYDIPFETFLGFYGDKEPDIDLNFSGDYQATAHKFVEQLFGKKNVFRAGTISTIASKTAYGFVKNYIDEGGEFKTKAEINRLVRGCGGVKKTTGQHPGGIMVMPKGHSIHEFTSIQRPADSTNSEIVTTHFDFNSLHGSLLKLDILGHDDPTMLKMLEVLTKINPIDIDIVDEKIMSLFTSNEALNIKEKTTTSLGVLGIPEFGTKFVRSMLKSTKPKTFSELVRISGLSHGTDVWVKNAQDLINNKIATLNKVICTRDDIMLYLINSGIENKIAFDIMEKVRRGNGITNEEEILMKKNNIPKWYIESCKKIKYMFPKAHAVAYVIMALRVAWYKIYYPLEYYVAFLSIRADEFDCDTMGNGIEYARKELTQLSNIKKLNARENKISNILEIVIEMYARGYEFLSIDLYKSDKKNFVIENNKIRMPFSSVAGLGEKAAIKILRERENGKFLTIDGFKSRTQVSKTVIEKLIEMKVFEGVPASSQISFF